MVLMGMMLDAHLVVGDVPIMTRFGCVMMHGNSGIMLQGRVFAPDDTSILFAIRV